MITWTIKYGNPAKPHVEGFCLSTDTLPTEGVENGSNVVEMDTSKVKFFDETNETWREF